MHGLNELREQGRMTWIEEEAGWSAAPEDIVDALSNDGFQECEREPTRAAGGLWEGVNTRTGSVALAIWRDRPRRARAIVFITIDGTMVGALNGPGPAGDPDRDDGGEG